MNKVEPFDAAAYLDTPELMVEYLQAALEEDKPEVFLAAVGDVARARGMSRIARRSGLGRESLYKALASGAKPRYDTLLRVLAALDLKLTLSLQEH